MIGAAAVCDCESGGLLEDPIAFGRGNGAGRRAEIDGSDTLF